MILFRMEDFLDIVLERLGMNVVNFGILYVFIGFERLYELYNIECGMGNKIEGFERLFFEVKFISFIFIGMDWSLVEKLDNVGGWDVILREVVKEVVFWDLIRV